MQLFTDCLIAQKRLQQLLGPPGSRDSPQYSDRSQDCHFASPTQTHLDRAQGQEDVEQDYAECSFREGNNAGGESSGLREGQVSNFSHQVQGNDNDGGQEREASDKGVASSVVTDHARSDSAKVTLPGPNFNCFMLLAVCVPAMEHQIIDNSKSRHR